MENLVGSSSTLYIFVMKKIWVPLARESFEVYQTLKSVMLCIVGSQVQESGCWEFLSCHASVF